MSLHLPWIDADDVVIVILANEPLLRFLLLRMKMSNQLFWFKCPAKVVLLFLPKCMHNVAQVLSTMLWLLHRIRKLPGVAKNIKLVWNWRFWLMSWKLCENATAHGKLKAEQSGTNFIQLIWNPSCAPSITQVYLIQTSYPTTPENIMICRNNMQDGLERRQYHS